MSQAKCASSSIDEKKSFLSVSPQRLGLKPPLMCSSPFGNDFHLASQFHLSSQGINTQSFDYGCELESDLFPTGEEFSSTPHNLERAKTSDIDEVSAMQHNLKRIKPSNVSDLNESAYDWVLNSDLFPTGVESSSTPHNLKRSKTSNINGIPAMQHNLKRVKLSKVSDLNESVLSDITFDDAFDVTSINDDHNDLDHNNNDDEYALSDDDFYIPGDISLNGDRDNDDEYALGDDDFPIPDDLPMVQSPRVIDKSQLAHWDLPHSIQSWYLRKGITSLFPWQVECLTMPNVLEGRNLVYSAPTSAGKTIVADLLTIRQVTTTNKKAVIILPFVSVGREKMLSLKSMFSRMNIRVGGFFGATHTLGGFATVDIAICTIEKANNIINKLIEENCLDLVGTIVVDELHMLGDEQRGYLLELLLTKVIYLMKTRNLKIQLIGMSATIPNLPDISKWLNAELYVTDYRPVPFVERIKIADKLYRAPNIDDEKKVPNNGFPIKANDVYQLILETMMDGNGCLVFCHTKAKCETAAKTMASFLKHILESKWPPLGESNKKKLKKILDSNGTSSIIDQLARSPASLEPIFEQILPFGVAFHHAGLSQDERDIIEDSFRRGLLKCLFATSTLSAGVNLPARRVIVTSPIFFNTTMDTLTYRQMIGRAGRKGIDKEGESILICQSEEIKAGTELVKASMRVIKSSLIAESSLDKGEGGKSQDLMASGSVKKAVLEAIASGLSASQSDVSCYMQSTFFSVYGHIDDEIIRSAIDYLLEFNFIYEELNEKKLLPTKLGKAVLVSSISPSEALYYVNELEKAQKAFVLHNDIHILFEVTLPFSGHTKINWQRFFDIWNSLDHDSQHAGEIVGINPAYIQRNCTQTAKTEIGVFKTHVRFYYALALNDLVHEMPLKKVSEKFGLAKGDIQMIQVQASTFAGIVAVFCNKLGYDNLDLIIRQYQERLQFGVQRDLIDLMRITCLNAEIARDLFRAGFNSVACIARSTEDALEETLRNSQPFKLTEGNKENLERKVWVSGQCKAVDNREIAALIVKEARNILEKEVGTKINWANVARLTEEPEEEPNFIEGNSKTFSKEQLSVIKKILLKNVRSKKRGIRRLGSGRTGKKRRRRGVSFSRRSFNASFSAVKSNFHENQPKTEHTGGIFVFN